MNASKEVCLADNAYFLKENYNDTSKLFDEQHMSKI